jgi:hypothetical protein
MKIHPVGAELFHADGHEADNRFSQFCERAKKSITAKERDVMTRRVRHSNVELQHNESKLAYVVPYYIVTNTCRAVTGKYCECKFVFCVNYLPYNTDPYSVGYAVAQLVEALR